MKWSLFRTPLYSGAAPLSPQHTEFFAVCTVLLKHWFGGQFQIIECCNVATGHFERSFLQWDRSFGIAYWRSPRISHMKWAFYSDITVLFITTYIAFGIIRFQRTVKIDEIVMWTQKYIVYNLSQRSENKFRRHGEKHPTHHHVYILNPKLMAMDYSRNLSQDKKVACCTVKIEIPI